MAIRRYLLVALAAASLPVLALPGLAMVPPTVGTQPSSFVLIDSPPPPCPPPASRAPLGIAHRELYRVVFPPGPPGSPLQRLTFRLLGFPFYSIALESIDEAPAGAGSWRLAHIRDAKVLWLGLTANSAFAVAFIVPLYATYRRVRREPPPGQCRRCGYPCAQSTTCPECGAPVSPPRRSDTVAKTS